jgi:DNA-binding NarL/FixJ family response regulator
MSNKQGMGKRNEPQPTFDFTQVGRNLSKDWTHLLNKANGIAKILASLMPEGNSREELEEFEELYHEYHERLIAVGDEQAALICKVLKSVPKNWLIKDAPASLDWSDVESLDWIQADRYSQLLHMIGSGEHYKLSAKNSVGTTLSPRSNQEA